MEQRESETSAATTRSRKRDASRGASRGDIFSNWFPEREGIQKTRRRRRRENRWGGAETRFPFFPKQKRREKATLGRASVRNLRMASSLCMASVMTHSAAPSVDSAKTFLNRRFILIATSSCAIERQVGENNDARFRERVAPRNTHIFRILSSLFLGGADSPSVWSAAKGRRTWSSSFLLTAGEAAADVSTACDAFYYEERFTMRRSRALGGRDSRAVLPHFKGPRSFFPKKRTRRPTHFFAAGPKNEREKKRLSF